MFSREHELPYVVSSPSATALIRSCPEDFQVIEELPYTLSGEGEHVWLLLRKRNTNTEWLARQLTRIAGVRPVDIGYAGLKDRYALTTQWFSVNLSGKKEPNWVTTLNSEMIQVVKTIRHHRKLQRGALKGNWFLLTLRQFCGSHERVSAGLERIKVEGVPNYFGSQRFGRENQNLVQAYQWFTSNQPPKDRHLRGLLLSAARALLFNKVLADRVQVATWNQPISGDALILNGSRGFFITEDIDKSVQDRIKCFDCHPSGPLWGKGEAFTVGFARTFEEQALLDFSLWQEGLEREGLKQERRSLRLMITDLKGSFLTKDSLQLQFFLPAGAYATTVLRELVSV